MKFEDSPLDHKGAFDDDDEVQEPFNTEMGSRRDENSLYGLPKAY